MAEPISADSTVYSTVEEGGPAAPTVHSAITQPALANSGSASAAKGSVVAERVVEY